MGGDPNHLQVMGWSSKIIPSVSHPRSSPGLIHLERLLSPSPCAAGSSTTVTLAEISTTHSSQATPRQEEDDWGRFSRMTFGGWVFQMSNEKKPFGCFLKWWYPPKHPKMIIFSRKTHGCWVPPFIADCIGDYTTQLYGDFHKPL